MGFEEGIVGRGNTFGVGIWEVAVVHVDTVGRCEMLDLNARIGVKSRNPST